MAKWNDDSYVEKELRNNDLVDCWALCFGAFVVVVGAVIGITWVVKGIIWTFTRLLGGC